MRRYLTIGITKTGTVDILHGADKGYSLHREEFLKMAAGRKKGPSASGYAEVHIVDISKGMVKRRRFAHVRVKGVDESGKRTIARSVKSSKAKKIEKAAAPKRKQRKPKPAKGKSATGATTATAKADATAKASETA